MEPHVKVTPNDVQGSLNRVFGAIRDDDAPLGKRECKDMLLKLDKGAVAGVRVENEPCLRLWNWWHCV